MFRFTAEAPLRVFLPESLVDYVLRQYHDICGHPGLKVTLKLITRRFYFLDLRNKVRFYVNNCRACVHGKVPRHTSHTHTSRVKFRGDHPGDVLTMDVYYIGYDIDGYTHVLVIVCDLSG